jgi:pre-mRNA-processing factor 17
MSGLIAAYDSSDDEAQPVPSTSTSTSRLPSTTAGPAADEDVESDDERLEAQARTDAFGLSEANGSSAVQKRKDANGKVVIASAPDVLREVSRMTV